jgi:hypothetical protein
MTVEHILVVGLDDIRAVTIECKCGTRVSLQPDNLHIPEKCPATGCDTIWIKGKSFGLSSEHDEWTSAQLTFVEALGNIRSKPQNGKPTNGVFKIFLEYDMKPQQV